MSIFDSNKIFLKRKYPNLLAIIDEKKSSVLIQQVSTRNNEPNLLVNKDSKQYLLHSKYNAKDEAQKWLSTLDDLDKSGTVFLFGIGLGYFLEALLELKEVKQLFIWEPDTEIFNHLLSCRDIKVLLGDSRIKFLSVGDDDFFVVGIANQISTYISSTNLSIISPTIYQRMYGELYKELNEELKNSMYSQLSNIQTLDTFQNMWLPNILNNLVYSISSNSVEILEGAYAGTTAIIVGSGPSLEADIEKLKLLRNKCLIIAAGSSIQALQHHNIRPHLLVSMDGGVSNLRVFDNIDTEDIPLLFIAQIHSGILDKYSGKMVHAIFGQDLISKYLLADYNIPAFLNTATVTGTAIQAAVYMGVREIILMGQDLSYPDKKYYTSGVLHISDENMSNVMKQAILTVKNVNGGENPTTAKMMITLEDIEKLIMIESYKDANIKFINASKNGADIKGASFYPLEQLMEGLLQYSDDNYDVEQKITILDNDQKYARYGNMNNKLRFVLKQCDVVEKKVDQLSGIFRELSLHRSNLSANKLAKELTKVEELWTSITNKEVFTVFYSFSRAQYLNAYRRQIPKIVEENDLKKKSALITQYLGIVIDNFIDFIPDLKGEINSTIKRLDDFFEGRVGK